MKKHLSEKYGHPVETVYFIGIGGSSMSGLAKIALEQGFHVEGSDQVNSKYTELLSSRGAVVHIGQKAENIHDGIDLVVYTAAIHPDNPEMVAAGALGIPKVERADYLGLLSEIFPKTIGVAGTHGKTTTSSMIATILHCADLDPSVSIGGNIPVFGGNAALGQSNYFVIESCEYVDSFLKTSHNIGIITNIEEDHLDYFKGGLEQIKHSFHKFGEIIPPDGLMIAWGDSQDVLDAVKDLKCQVVTYGLSDKNDWVAKNIAYDSNGNPAFDAYHGGTFAGHYQLRVPGQHNVLNALACIACADYLGVGTEAIEKALDQFSGANFCGLSPYGPDYRPKQREFNRLNITYTVMSKRKMLQLVKEGLVAGWDDPRMPTVCGLRRRGYTPSSIRTFMDRIGYTKVEGMIDQGLLEHTIREDLKETAPRVCAIFDPVKLIITNYEGEGETLTAENIDGIERIGI